MMAADRTILRQAGAVPTRMLVATRISRGIAEEIFQEGRSGSILSVHSAAVNIRWGGNLLVVGQEFVGGLPCGVLVTSPSALDRIGLADGMAVRADGANLLVPEASLVVSLTAAVWWSPRLPATRRLSPRPRAARAQWALQLAAAAAPPIGLGPLLAALVDGRPMSASLSSTAAAQALAIVEGLSSASPDQAITAAVPLIGLGPGATPSGDDLLIGMAAGLAIGHHPLARPFAAGVAIVARGRTTAVAEALLMHAGRLEFAERVHHAACAVVGADSGEMRSAISATLAWGASSGADFLVGLLIGVQVDSQGIARRLRDITDRRASAA